MKTGILGAGPAGLTMSMFLDGDKEVLERGLSPGGAASSFTDEGFTFDHGPHIMFSKNEAILNFMVRSLKGNVHRCRRNNMISFKNQLVRYPFENNLGALPLQDNYECISAYLFNPHKKDHPHPANLKEWLLFHFGEGICGKYLFPYNEKVWNLPVEELSMIWADRIPKPPPEDVLKSALGFQTEGYLHQLHYHYPLRGGYQAISLAWARNQNVVYGYEVKKIARRSGKWVVSNGSEERVFDRIVSTLPIQELVRMLDQEVPVKVQEAIRGLRVNPMYVISLGVRGEDPNQYTAIYFPEPDFLVNRISYPRTFSPHNSPTGTYSIQAEITCRKDSQTWGMKDEEVLAHVIGGLEKRGLLDRGSLVYQKLVRRPYAYVVYDLAYEQNARMVRDWFPAQGIELAGRFGYFEYLNVDGIVDLSLKIASKMDNKKIDIENY